MAFHGVFLNITRFAYCFFTHRIPGSWHFIMVLSQSEASGIVFYTQDSRELAFHIVFVAIRSLVYCLITQDYTGFPGVCISYCVCHNQKPRVLFFTQHCREWACHSVFVPTRSLLCCFLHWVGWSWPVIVCLPLSEASCIVLNAGLPGVGISLCVCHNQKPREMF